MLTRGRVLVNAKLTDDLAARVLHRNVREAADVEAELLEEGSECDADGSLRAVLDLERDPRPSRAAQSRPSAPPFATQPSPSR